MMHPPLPPPVPGSPDGLGASVVYVIRSGKTRGAGRYWLARGGPGYFLGAQDCGSRFEVWERYCSEAGDIVALADRVGGRLVALRRRGHTLTAGERRIRDTVRGLERAGQKRACR